MGIDKMLDSEHIQQVALSKANKSYQELLTHMQDLVLDDEAHDLFVLTNEDFKISHNTMTRFESEVAQSAVVFNSE